MRLHLLTVLTSLVFCPFLNAQVSLDMEPVDANGAITSVTLYRNRAAITRTTTLDLDAGGYSIFFRDLPNSAYLDSVQAHVSDNAGLLSVDTSNKPIVKDNRDVVAQLTKQIEQKETEMDGLNAAKQAIELQIAMLQTLIKQSGGEEAPPIDLATFRSQLDFIGDQMTTLAASLITNENQRKEVQDEIQTLKRKRGNLGPEQRNQIDAIVDIGMARAGTVTVELTYLVLNASWHPVYSIRASEGGDAIVIEYDAEIAQRTGENWTNVAMTLSTAQPQRSATPPMPTPWYVNVQPPVSPNHAPQARRGYKTEEGRLGRTELGVMAVMDMAVEEASAAASVVGDGPAVSFVLPRTVIVPSNAEDSQTISLAAIDAEANLYHVAVPMLNDSVYIRSEVTNASPYILLPGRASIFHGSDYVGKTTLATVTPNETFTIDLGVDASVTATRSLIEKNTATTGLFASAKQTAYNYQIAISNGHDESIDVRVWDRIPISRDETIEILLKELSHPLSTDPNYLKTDRPRGLLRWDLGIDANMTGKQTYALDWRVEVARGKDVEMTPLPE
jgi:uncharacterized protein (TIGR02231 family)